MESIRNQHCYICGNNFNPTSPPPVDMVLEKRPRKVHRTCKGQHEKAMKDLVWMNEQTTNTKEESDGI